MLTGAAATALTRTSGSSPPPLRSLREIVPLPTINHKAARAGFLQSPSLDVAQQKGRGALEP
jgi:hypothetical protein